MRLDGRRKSWPGSKSHQAIIVGRPVRLRSPHDREIVRLALPALGALAAEPLYVLADTAIVGHLGRPQIAALGLAGTVLAGAFTIFNFLTYGTTAVVARASGAGRHDEAAGSPRRRSGPPSAIGLVLLVACEIVAEPLLAGLGGHGRVRRLRAHLLPDRSDRAAGGARRPRRPGLPARRLEPPPAARDRRRGEPAQPRPRDPLRLRLPLGHRGLGGRDGDRAGRDGRRLRRRAAAAARAVAPTEPAGDEAALPHRQADLRAHGGALRVVPGRRVGARADGRRAARRASDRLPALHPPRAHPRRGRDRRPGDRRPDARRRRRRRRVRGRSAHDRVVGRDRPRLRRRARAARRTCCHARSPTIRASSTRRRSSGRSSS